MQIVMFVISFLKFKNVPIPSLKLSCDDSLFLLSSESDVILIGLGFRDNFDIFKASFSSDLATGFVSVDFLFNGTLTSNAPEGKNILVYAAIMHPNLSLINTRMYWLNI